jgi:hypothetical protein
MFPQPYAETAQNTRRSTPSSTSSDTCTHDPLFKDNLKVVNMCKNREMENCVDQNRLYNRMESGKECSGYENFAGKYLYSASANDCIKQINTLQLDFDYMVFKSDTN